MSQKFLLRSRILMGFVLASILTATSFVVCDSAGAQQRAAAVVGSFSVGGDLSGGIDERSGVFATEVPLVGLPGVVGASGGGFDLGVSYRQDAAAEGRDRYGLGSAWVWSVTYVDTDNGVRVFPASGGMLRLMHRGRLVLRGIRWGILFSPKSREYSLREQTITPQRGFRMHTSWSMWEV